MTRICIHVSLCVCLIAISAACAGKSDHEGANVIVITLDALRRDHVYSDADEKGPSPFMDQLADRSVCFRNALAPSSWTKPSVASIITGLYPSRHGAIGLSKRETTLAALSTDHVTLAERLKTAGYKTGAFATNPFIIPEFNFHQGFDDFTQPAGNGAELFAKALDWIDHWHEKDKFFLYLHLIDPHDPYDPPEEYRKRYVEGGPIHSAAFLKRGDPMGIRIWLKQYKAWRTAGAQGDFSFDYDDFMTLLKHKFPYINSDIGPEEARKIIFLDFDGFEDSRFLERIDRLSSLYKGDAAYTDDLLKGFIQAMEERGLLEKTILVITADHGESLMEHENWGHRKSVHGEEINIPMIFLIPGPEGGSIKGTFDDYVSLVDLYPTILDIISLSCDKKLDGLSLWPLIQGTKNSLDRRAPVFTEAILTGGDQISAVINGKKLIRKLGSEGREEYTLYDIEEDPKETRPLDIKVGGKTAELLKRSIKEFIKTRFSNLSDKNLVDQLPEDVIKQMKSLGYF